MSRFYIPKESVRGNEICVTGKEAHHIINVMRLSRLDKVVTFDGTGKEYLGFIKELKPKALVIEITGTRITAQDDSIITLVQAIPKKDKMDYIVEKATELGAASIIPVVTDRVIPDWDESKKSNQAERWQKIAKESAKQCGRADIPEIGRVVEFQHFLTDMGGYDLKLIAALAEESISLKDALKDFKGKRVAVAIGPEGDFTPGEVSAAKAAGFKLISLGCRVLRSDTAGLAALSILNYELSK